MEATSPTRPPLNYFALTLSAALVLFVALFGVLLLESAQHDKALAEIGIKASERKILRAIYGPHYFQMGVRSRIGNEIVAYYAKHGRVPETLSDLWPGNSALRFDGTRLVAWNQQIDYCKTGDDSWLFISGGDDGAIQTTLAEAEGIRDLEPAPGGDEVERHRIRKSADGVLDDEWMPER